MVANNFKFRAVVGSQRRGAKMTDVIMNYTKLVRHLEVVSPDILLDAMQPTFALSQQYCPTDTGRLKDSGYLEITERRGRPTVEIGYGFGGEPPYATAVHENLEWQHKAPTRAKWLQVALEEDAQNIQDRIVADYRSVFGGV